MIIYCCKKCGNMISSKTALYGKGFCRSCSVSKENNPNWKGGKPKCVDCDKKLSNHDHTRCFKCNKKFQVGINASNYKAVKYICKDCGKKLANMYAKRCQSCSSKGSRNSHFGVLPNHSQRIKYNKITFRSGWEANFAKWCDGSEIKWKYESRTFNLGNTTYTPDFYLPEFDCYIEIKGWWRKEAKDKFDKFLKEYNELIYVFDKKKLKGIGVL